MLTAFALPAFLVLTAVGSGMATGYLLAAVLALCAATFVLLSHRLVERGARVA